MSDDGPFTDEMVRGYLMAAQTQQGIIKYAEAMAQVLAEAGRASHQATGDRPQYAMRRWLKVIENRALELLKENANAKQVEGKIIDADARVED